MKIVVSGIQPTGNIHLGNYLGAIKQWKDLQSTHICRFGIMDLHAMTTNSLNDNASKSTFNTLVKCGIKEENIFLQSDIQRIKDLYWFLSCNTSINQLNRMTQFKEKTEKGNENLGLFSYPVLMSADILALEADLVPVGEDQKQHLELARDLAKKLGFKIPEPLISKTCGRVMSLLDPSKKMSKSDVNDNSRINLSDSADTVFKKIRKSVTNEDSITNLTAIYNACGGQETLDFSNALDCKNKIANQIITELCLT